MKKIFCYDSPATQWRACLPMAAAALLPLSVLLAAAGGCGSGNSTVGGASAAGSGTSSGTTTSRAKTGSVTFTVKWPSRPPAKTASAKVAKGKAAANGTKYIPLETQTITVVVTDAQGAVAGQAVIGGGSGTALSGTQTAHITGLVPGTYTVSASAAVISGTFSGVSSGVSLASASAPLVIQSGQDTPISMTLVSTIVKVVFNASASTAILGQAVTFSGPVGYDASGNVISSGSNFNSGGEPDYAPGFTINYGTGFDSGYAAYDHGYSETLKTYAAKVGSQIVTATDEGGATAQATVTVTEAATMAVTPSEVTIAPGGTLPSSFQGVPSLVPLSNASSFLSTAALNTTPNVQQPVLAVWQVQEGTVGGTISQSSVQMSAGAGADDIDYFGGGLYVAGTTPGTYHIIAQNWYDHNFTATALVHVTASGPAVTMTPAAPTVGVGSTTAFKAQVANNSVQTVTWSIVEGAAGGTIDANGNYTAPTTSGTYHIQATSSADTRGVGTATVTVLPIGNLQGIIQ